MPFKNISLAADKTGGPIIICTYRGKHVHPPSKQNKGGRGRGEKSVSYDKLSPFTWKHDFVPPWMWSGLRASRAERWMKRACLQKLLGFHGVSSGLPTAFPLFSPNWPVLAFMDTSRCLTAGKHTLNHEARTDQGWGKRNRSYFS